VTAEHLASASKLGARLFAAAGAWQDWRVDVSALAPARARKKKLDRRGGVA
jgi:hypothetical protein